MDRVKEPDLVVDRCPECGGTFFDKGELDVLVAGLSGMHLHLFPEPERQDAHSATKCTKPSCGGETMLKKTISDLSEIIFDYCPKCEGIFLDKGEIQEVSQELEPSTEANLDKKTREYIDGYLVVEESACVRWDPGSHASPENFWYFVRSSIYFKESLGLGLNMFSEKWTDKLFKGIGLSRKQDIQVGDDQINSRFIIQGTDEKEIISLLSYQNIRKNINLLEEKRLKKAAVKGSFKIIDNKVTYSEGPHITHSKNHVVGYADIADPEGEREAMLNLVKSVEDCYE